MGERIDTIDGKWSLPDDACYGVLFEVDVWRSFVEAVRLRDDLTHVFVVTDSDAVFQQISLELPTSLPRTQLYSDYLHTFEVNTRGRT
ncbi:MAG: hypothetical protein ACOYBY_10900 [Dermatophilaceae bacterium]